MQHSESSTQRTRVFCLTLDIAAVPRKPAAFARETSLRAAQTLATWIGNGLPIRHTIGHGP
jgi:hypothetical protein